MVEDAAVLDLLVRALDEPELGDAGEARERRDEADVRAFRRLDRTDAAVVRGVDVAHLEPGALAREAARPEGRETPLVRDLGKGVRLVHELRELRGPEELLDRRDDGLGVDEVVRHRRVDVLVDGHLFLDRALHADEADAELVLEELADAAHPAVAEVVDVVGLADVPLELEEVLDHDVEVLGREGLLVERRREARADVELEAADAREVVLPRVEEHAREEVLRALVRRRVAGTHALVDLEERLALRLDAVLAEGRDERLADRLPVREDRLDARGLLALELGGEVLGDLGAGLEQDLARAEVDDVGGEEGAAELRRVDGRLDALALRERFLHLGRQLDVREDAAVLADAAEVLDAGAPPWRGRRAGGRGGPGPSRTTASRRSRTS